jgi:tetratricopeptide (TPR) repeat protein
MGFLNLFGKPTNPWLIKGDYLKSKCEVDSVTEAITYYDKEIESNPQSAEAWYKKGHCYHILRQDEDAGRCYDEALKINPNDAEVWYAKGRSCDGSNSDDCFKKAKEIDPAYKKWMDFLEPRRLTGYDEVPPRDPRTWCR